MHLLAIILLGISSNLDTLGVGLAYGTRKYRLPFLSNFVCALIPSAGTCLMMVIGETLRSVIPNPFANVLGAAIVMAAGAILIVQHVGRPRPGRPSPGRANPGRAQIGRPHPEMQGFEMPSFGRPAPCRPSLEMPLEVPTTGVSTTGVPRPGVPNPSDQAKAGTPPRHSLLSNMKDLGQILEDPFRADYDYSGSIEIKEAMVLAFALALNNLANGLAAGLMGLNIFLTAVTAIAVSLIFFSTGINIGLRFMGRWIGERGDLAAGLILILLGIYELLL